MSKLQKNKNQIIFIDYIPAELRENKTWRVEYAVKNPFTGKLERKQPRVKPLKSIVERRKLGKRMVAEINKRLESGWNPFYANKGAKELTKFTDALEIYFKRVLLEYKEDNLRYDTFKTYRSQITILKEYIATIGKNEMMSYKFDVDFVNAYLDFIRYDKGVSARTRNNYLGFLGTLSSFLIEKKYITVNPTITIKKLSAKQKKRVLIPEKTRILIFDYWKQHNTSFLTLCMICYYCLIRRTELTKLKVSNVSLKNSTIWIDGEDSKNKKNQHITIPNALFPFLVDHLKNAKNSDYLFSTNFIPGPVKIHPDRVTKKWNQMRKVLHISNEIHWYSLKDSGITDLLRAGVPLISVRDQARHYSSAQTDTYTPKELKKADKNIQTSGVKFN